MRFEEKIFFYDRYAGIQREAAEWAAAWLPLKYGLEQTVLELGAGTGNFTRYLKKHHHRLLATDISSAMVSEGAVRLPDVQWAGMDAWSPDCKSVDLIYSASLLQWAPNPREVLKNWYRCLREGGRMLAVFFLKGTLQEFDVFEDFVMPLQFYNEQQWISFFATTGFRVRRLDSLSKIYLFPSPIDLLRHLHGTGATFKNRISPSRLRVLLREYEKRYSRDDGVVSTWKMFRVECERKESF